MIRFKMIFILSLIITVHNYSQDAFDLNVSNEKITVASQNLILDTFVIYRSHINIDDIALASPVLGTYQRSASTYSFTPIVPFTDGNKYTLWLNEETLHYFTVGVPDNYDYLTVDKLFPSSQHIPANIIQWHLIFNKSVQSNDVYDHIFITDNKGDTIDQAIYHLDFPFFDDQNTQLTIHSEPYKKTGQMSQETGFMIGQTYTIHITNGLTDEKGIPMKESWSSNFSITDPDLSILQVNNWKVVNPIVNTLLPLEIQTGDLLDLVSTLHNIEIYNRETLEKVNGILSLENEESEIVFTPHLPWVKGEYEIRIYDLISDVAGNKYDKLFDEGIFTLTRADRYSEKGEHRSLYFEIK